MTTEQIEHEAFSESILEGQLQLPSERVHNFVTHSALVDFAVTFRIVNYNVRTGELDGKTVFQLIYQPVNN